jgi:hypothetical protein
VNGDHARRAIRGIPVRVDREPELIVSARSGAIVPDLEEFGCYDTRIREAAPDIG